MAVTKTIGAIPPCSGLQEHDKVVAAINHISPIYQVASSLVNLIKDHDTTDGTMSRWPQAVSGYHPDCLFLLRCGNR